MDKHIAHLGFLIASVLFFPCVARGEFDVIGGKLDVKGAVTIGTSVRTESIDSSLVSPANARSDGGEGSSGRNQDDGNLNYNRGDTVYNVVKSWLHLTWNRDNYGAELSGKTWYDAELSNGSVPWGNSVDGYQAGSPLSDTGAAARTKFSGVVFNDANFFGRNQIAHLPVSWKLGWQRIEWGNQYYSLGGLRDLMPIDLPAELRPGVKRDEETRIPIPAYFIHADLTGNTVLESFWQIAFTPNAPHQCGTFYSQMDFVAEGCDIITVGNGSDPASMRDGLIVNRADTRIPSRGQFGIALKHKVDTINTEFGFYAAQYHSRSSYFSAMKSQRPVGPPLIPGDPGNKNPTYFTEYPENIRMYALSFGTTLSRSSLFGELTYRPNQPFQYNAIDLLSGFSSNTGITPLRPKIDNLAPGALFHGYERHKSLQLQLGSNIQLFPLFGASRGQVGIQGIFQHVPDLPDANDVRFRRSDVFGQGPVNGNCTGSSVQCSNDGYVSKQAYGYRLQASLVYQNIFKEIEMIPSLFFGHDLSGWSEDGSINEGRKFAILSLKGVLKKAYTAEIAWLPIWGGDYNNMRDRSVVQAVLGMQF